MIQNTLRRVSVRGFTVNDSKLTDYSKFFKLKGPGAIRAKFLPETLYSADCSIEIFDWAVRIVIMRSKQAIIVESSELAIAMKQIFDLLWEKTRGEYDEPQQLKLKEQRGEKQNLRN